MKREFQLLDYLSRHFELKVVYLGQLDSLDHLAMPDPPLNYKIHDIGTGQALSEQEWVDLFKNQKPEVREADAYIIRGIENSYMLGALPKDSTTFLDTMDLVSERSQKGGSENVLVKMTREEETSIFRRYSQIICIQEDETALAGQWIGRENVLTAKHPVEAVDAVSESNRRKIGLVASRWPPNAYGLRDFARHCWPTVRKTGATLDVYGNISEVLNASLPAVTFHGYVDDIQACYAEVGLMINPVQYGAGLKIKSIEAMAQGLPLLTSREGASGLEQLDGKALVIADSWGAFTEQLLTLMEDEAWCLELAQNALDYINEHLNPEACFAELRSKIESL